MRRPSARTGASGRRIWATIHDAPLYDERPVVESLRQLNFHAAARYAPERGPRLMRFHGLLLALLLSAAIAHAQPPAGPPSVGVVRAQQTAITETSEFVGRVQAVERVALTARVTAFLDQRLFNEGSEVKQGDVLYRLERAP